MGINCLLGIIVSGFGYYLTFMHGYDTPEQISMAVEVGWIISFKFIDVGTINGNMVYIIWVIEALIIIACAFGGVFMMTNKPFCERCGVWTKKNDLGTVASVDAETIKGAVENRDLNTILELKKAPGSDKRLNLSLHSCPKCTGWNLLSMEFKWDEIDNTGKASEESEDVDGFIILRKEQLARLRVSMS